MAAELEHPERVVGFHFFNPVAVLPLLEIVAGRADRRRGARHRVRGRQGAEEVVRPGQGRPGVRGQPAAHPLPRRGHPRGRRGHPDSRSPTRARPARPADVAVRAAAAGRPGRRAARRRDPARGLPGPLRRLGEPRGWSRRASPASTSGTPAPKLDPEVGRALRQGDLAVDRGEVLDRALDALAEEIRLMLDEGVVADGRRTSTCACSWAPAGRSTWAAWGASA